MTVGDLIRDCLQLAFAHEDKRMREYLVACIMCLIGDMSTGKVSPYAFGSDPVGIVGTFERLAAPAHGDLERIARACLPVYDGYADADPFGERLNGRGQHEMGDVWVHAEHGERTVAEILRDGRVVLTDVVGLWDERSLLAHGWRRRAP